VVRATTGAVIQPLTNIDAANQYTCAAWDNVGNLYGASTTRHLWRVWSPPGPNLATTTAAAQVIVPTAFAVTSVTAIPVAFGCMAVTLTFTTVGNFNLAPSAFTLAGSATVNGVYTPTPGALIIGGGGVYQATALVCAGSQFFKIEQN